MGLLERRKIQELQNEVLPQRSQEIADICGRAVPYEVDWASLEQDAQALNFVDNIACHRLNMALRTICTDEMGRAIIVGRGWERGARFGRVTEVIWGRCDDGDEVILDFAIGPHADVCSADGHGGVSESRESLRAGIRGARHRK